MANMNKKEWAALIWIIFVVCMWISIGYVAIHFIRKYW